MMLVRLIRHGNAACKLYRDWKVHQDVNTDYSGLFFLMCKHFYDYQVKPFFKADDVIFGLLVAGFR